MNKIIFAFVAFVAVLSLTHSVDAQVVSKVTYEKTIHIDPPEDIPVTSDIPTKRVEMYSLIFDETHSLYSKDTEFKDPNMDENSRRWRRGNKPHEIYNNYESNEQKEQINFFRKEFLVTDSLAELKWKIAAGEHRDILGYTAMKAILVDTSQIVEAWFTPQLPSSVGPSKYYGLPGLILAVTIDEDKVILATKVETDLTDIEIEAPQKGKKMGREEFTVLRVEKTAEMKKMWGNGKRRWRGR